MGICSFAAASAQASVELTSPATTTSAGRSSRRMRSKAISTLPVCSPWLPEPMPSEWSGAGKPRSSRISSDIRRS